MGGGSSVPAGCVKNDGVNYFSFTSTPDSVSFSVSPLCRVEVRAGDLVGACSFQRCDGTRSESGGSGGEGHKAVVFELQPNEHIRRVFFRQLVNPTTIKGDPESGSKLSQGDSRGHRTPQLCGIQFETNLQRKSPPVLLGAAASKRALSWQRQQGLAGEEHGTNWVYTASSGCGVVGYKVVGSWGEHGCPVISRFMEEPLREEGSVEHSGHWFRPFRPPAAHQDQDQEQDTDLDVVEAGDQLRSVQVSFADHLVASTCLGFAQRGAVLSGRPSPETAAVVKVSPDSCITRVFFRQNGHQLCGLAFETNFGQVVAPQWLCLDSRDEARQWQLQQGLGAHDVLSNFVHTAATGRQVVGYVVEIGDLSCPAITRFLETPIAPPGHTLLRNMSFRPFASTPPPEKRPGGGRRVKKILVRKVHNLIDASEFVFHDRSSTVCGGSNGAVQKHFMLEPGEHVTRVFFRQSAERLLGVLFETSTGRQGDYLLLQHHGWQDRDGLLRPQTPLVEGGREEEGRQQLNWVFEASQGCEVVGYHVKRPEVGAGGVILNFIEQPLPSPDA